VVEKWIQLLYVATHMAEAGLSRQRSNLDRLITGSGVLIDICGERLKKGGGEGEDEEEEEEANRGEGVQLLEGAGRRGDKLVFV
jgi:hypothetical protein